MFMFKNFPIAMEQLWASKSRSLLTMVGMVIAVASTITVVSVVLGFSRYVAEFLKGWGTNAVWVAPERPAGEAGRTLGRAELDIRDVESVKERCEALRLVSPNTRQSAVSVRYGRDEVNAPLEGVSVEYHAIRKFEVETGRPFAVVDIEQSHQVCLVGHEVLRKLSVDEELVGQSLLLDGRRFQVIGILKEKGALIGTSQDDLVLVPYTMALKMYPSQRRKLAFVATATSEDQVPEARAQITNLLRRRHGLEAHQPNDFSIRTQDEILEAFNAISLAATAMLAGIVGISLLVSGIGIMNMMLVSVTERTREIGLRKAVGAGRRDILAQFLAEAVTLSILGGGIGVALGFCLCALASQHPKMVDVVVPWWAVALGFGISAGTGTVFGLLPAVKAALLNPIDALRHE
ncbi:ABC transporter permease [Paludisphaera borealis]|uniref:Macrolide export ATP-binding/permease protein MacB n=1 Tax=Paludisphaera borealis TaxID=1387353 RepID=A0A1U7CTU1_9BACT|nr:ABC transporter permease [Paludisphaera borealis]APW62342.1 Macrolide export ATP-binding/permease protein MacB [Paludisphaera borealis]